MRSTGALLLAAGMVFWLSISGISRPASLAAENEAGSQGVVVQPGRTTAVELSATDVNRIICPDVVTDYVFSQEKGMTVTAKGESLFVKYLATVQPTGEREFNRTPNELFITSAGEVYSLITHPRQIPSQTVWLAEPRQVNVKEALERYAGLPEELVVVDLVRMAFRGEADDTTVVERHEERTGVVTGLTVWLNEERRVEGLGLTVKVFTIRNTSGAPTQLTERLFLTSGISARPLAIALEKVFLKADESGRLFVIERTHDVGETQG
ncbi:MAG: type-F conjugative transfer system secretin TraK [Candidatus Eisenbacteria bacterium]